MKPTYHCVGTSPLPNDRYAVEKPTSASGRSLALTEIDPPVLTEIDPLS